MGVTNKAFFEPQKEFYNNEIKRPAEEFGDDIARSLGQLTGRDHKSKLFRIYRDVRISKDKTPYNTHLHLLWSATDTGAPSWFFGAAPDYIVLGMGVMGMDGAALDAYRAFIDREGAELQSEMETAGAQISDWGPAPLKRVPKPYEQDHPQADMLRRKALAVTCDLKPDWRETGIVAAIDTKAKDLLPVYKRLSSINN